LLKFSLATSESYKDKDGQRKEKTEWHRVNVWGKRGEALAGFLRKGERVAVEGSIRSSSYEKNGEKRTSVEIHATDIELLGDKGSAPRQEPAQAPRSGWVKPQPYAAQPDDSGSNFDDIPF